MGNFFKSKTEVTKTKNPYEQNPWEPQQPYLKEGFKAGSDALQGALSGLNGITDLTADLTNGQRSDLNASSTLGRGVADSGQDIMASIQRYLGGGPDTIGQTAADRFTGNAKDIYNTAGGGGVGRTVNEGLDMARGVSGFNPGVDPTGHSQAIYGDVSQNKLGQVVGQAQGIAEDPYLQGQIDSVLGDIDKAFQTDRGRLNAAASGVGAINSTRAGVMEARMRDDAMDRAATISSGMRSNAYNKGLDLASSLETLRQGNALNANAAIQADDSLRLNNAGMTLDAKTAGLSGLLSAGDLQLGNRAQADATQLGANQQIAQGAELKNNIASAALDRFGKGTDILGGAYGLAQGGLQDSLAAGTIKQTQEQNEIAGMLQKLGLPMDFVQQYMSTIGGGYGSEGFNTTSQVTQKQSPFQSILGTASAIAGLRCWVAREVYGVNDPRWVTFRGWLISESPQWFFKLYVERGEAFAKFISDKPILKGIVRRVFNAILKRAYG